MLHWLTGTKSELKRAVELGCYFSINATMLSAERSQGLINQIPLDRLLTETDGPFTEIEGQKCRPVDVESAVATLSKFRGLSQAELKQQIESNLVRLVSGE